MTEPSDLEALSDDVKNLRADLARLADTVGGLARDGGSDLVQKGRRLARDLGDELQDHARDLTDAIEEKPFSASMISFGIGVLLGAILTGGRR